ncbi:MAG TPA: DUF1850 domain-containing protein [Rectinemataceae bacterium]
MDTAETGSPRRARVGQVLAPFLLAVGLLAFFARGFYWEPCLEILDESGSKLESVPLPDGLFSHVYTHSIHLSRVDEEFRIAGNSLELLRLRYDSYGVGMPSEGGEDFRIEDGRFVVELKRSFPKVQIRISHLPGHGLEFGGTFRPFTEWAPPESLIQLDAGKRLSYSMRRVLGL